MQQYKALTDMSDLKFYKLYLYQALFSVNVKHFMSNKKKLNDICYKYNKRMKYIKYYYLYFACQLSREQIKSFLKTIHSR